MQRLIRLNTDNVIFNGSKLEGKTYVTLELLVDIEPMPTLGAFTRTIGKRYGNVMARNIEQLIDDAIVAHVIAENLMS